MKNDYSFLPYSNIIKYEDNCLVCEISFQKISSVLDDEIFNKPIFQIDINDHKVNLMVEDYIKNSNFWYPKKNIILSYFNCSLDNSEYYIYLLDGQHRLSMAKILYDTYHIDGSLILYYYLVNNNDEMRNLFTSINMDSYKSQNYINIPELEKNNFDELKEKLYNKYKNYFAKSINTRNQLYTLSEFMDKIHKCNDINIDEIEKFNLLYNKQIGYKSLYLEDKSRFYKEEQDIIGKQSFYTFAFKNNNFIEYLLNKIQPIHTKFKKNKSRITPKLRESVWIKEYNELIEGICPIKDCNHIIYKNNFNCGHIISEYNGGETNLDNLRPICTSCNSKMGTKNWIQI